MDKELTLWKKELETRKDQNLLKMKEIKQQIESLGIRRLMLLEHKEQLKSNLYVELEEMINHLQNELSELKNENSDIGTIIYSIDIEIGNLIMCD